MTLSEIDAAGVTPALSLLPSDLDTLPARVMLFAIGLQESNFQYRQQLVGKPPTQTGPATSFWQGERGGGMVAGVRTHAATKKMAAGLYAARKVEATNAAIWAAMKFDDVLAAGLARLLLWSDPLPLPKLGEEEQAWQLYLRTWRPGAYTRGSTVQRANLRKHWAKNYQEALKYVQGT